MAADALARFARTTPSAWQCVTGLAWLEHMIDGCYDTFANHCWYVARWLAELRETCLPDAATLSRWRRVVDGLAASGDRRLPIFNASTSSPLLGGGRYGARV